MLHSFQLHHTLPSPSLISTMAGAKHIAKKQKAEKKQPIVEHSYSDDAQDMSSDDQGIDSKQEEAEEEEDDNDDEEQDLENDDEEEEVEEKDTEENSDDSMDQNEEDEEEEEEEQFKSNLSFSQLGLATWLVNALKAMSITSPSEIQNKCIPQILAGKDVIGGAKTGSGKTAAFALPILQKLSEDPYGVFAVVLTPTR